ncbi:MAG: hypothetical protein HY343_11005 [Lentisphaerae bacterium]|nr:hypothetical protein [Lentisphaerota bacterium]
MNEDKAVFTRILTKHEVEAVILGLPALIRKLVGDCILTVEYGTHSNLHNDLLYKPMEVGIAWLHRFLAESIDQRIFLPAGSDMSIATPDGGLEILFCHEGDIHLSGKNAALIQRVTQSELLRTLIK